MKTPFLLSFGFDCGIQSIAELDQQLIGSKGLALKQMSNWGFPVPPGFTISSQISCLYNKEPENYATILPLLKTQVEQAICRLGEEVGAKFGELPLLLLAIRSGAAVSMPGMMETVLNVGLNDQIVSKIKNKRFAFDSYARLIRSYGEVVCNIDRSLFKQLSYESSVLELERLVESYKLIIQKEAGLEFPQDLAVQLWEAIEAVFRSWNCHKALKYRAINNISGDLGTAVNIQKMVFGNMDKLSGTGVVFSRNPSTGAKGLFGDFLQNAQGEDVVNGSVNPGQVSRTPNTISLEEIMPTLFNELAEITEKLELLYRDMQDIEFTIESGKLWLLQARSGKRTANAAITIALNMVEEGIISKAEALKKIDLNSLSQLFHCTIAKDSNHLEFARGKGASPGVATGLLVLSSEVAERMVRSKQKVLLVRLDTSPDDIVGMHAAEGILTSRGGMTSHAAVVARGMGKPCVCGVDMRIDLEERTAVIAGRKFSELDLITIDGTTGAVIDGTVSVLPPVLPQSFQTVMSWTDELNKMEIRANVDTVNDLFKALELGATGIGLCRTEHMFFEKERLPALYKVVLASNKNERICGLQQLLEYQKQDFKALLSASKGLPVTIRLMDPPLHEFLPSDVNEVSALLSIEAEELICRINSICSKNSMLGHRGARLAVTYPEIYEMQVKAIAEASIELIQEGITVQPEIMAPFVMSREEVQYIRNLVSRTLDITFAKMGKKLSIPFGVMIELPRMALVADQIADLVEFCSFGSNDLTQMVFGISRDDAKEFLDSYLSQDLLPADPFIHIDEDGVGALISIAVAKLKKANAKIKLGLCGEHGGDPKSIAFLSRLNLDYISCSPYRIPTARLASAQVTLGFRG